MRTVRWDWQLHLEIWISASYSVLFSWAIISIYPAQSNKSGPVGKFKADFFHCLGAQLPKQWALQLTPLGMKSVRNLALHLPSTASTFEKIDSVQQYPLWSLLLVLHGALKLWKNWPDCTFLHLASTEPLGHGHKMYPCVWPVWNLGAPFDDERVSTGRLLWKSHHCKEKGRPWGVAMQEILKMLDRRNVVR